MTRQNVWAGRTLDALKVVLAPCFADKCSVTNLGMLQFAHLKPTGLSGPKRGRKERLSDVLNNPDCYALLCEDHHEDFDKEFNQTDRHSWVPVSVLERANELQLRLFRMQEIEVRAV